MPEGKYFYFKSQLNELCLDCSNGESKPENDTITWEYRGAPHQLWYFDQAFHVIRSKADEHLVLEERHDGYVIINTFHRGGEAQEWSIQGDRICRRYKHDRVLTIENGHTAHAAKLKVEDWEEKPEQRWECKHIDSPYFTIINFGTGKAVDINAGDASEGANLIMWDHHAHENQQWYEDREGFIRSRLNTFTISCRDGHAEMADIEVGHAAATYMRNNNNIINRYEPDKCLEIQDASPDNLAKLVEGHNQENEHQRWNFSMLE